MSRRTFYLVAHIHLGERPKYGIDGPMFARRFPSNAFVARVEPVFRDAAAELLAKNGYELFPDRWQRWPDDFDLKVCVYGRFGLKGRNTTPYYYPCRKKTP